MSEATGYPWQPIDITTPPKWHRFIGRRVGSTTIGIAGAFCPTAFFVGIELIRGSSYGLGLGIGPLWLGVAILRKDTRP